MSACVVQHTVEGPEDAAVLVLVNSLGSDMSMWELQVPTLRERLRVVRFDMRGHGASPVPPGPYAPADLGGDLLALLDRLELVRVSLCGVSLGAATAMWCAAHAPERVERLVVCFSSAWFGPPGPWLQRAALVRAEGTAAVAEAVVGRWFTESFQRENPEAIARMRAMVAATPSEGYAACCEALAALDLRGQLGSIAAPTLVLSGSEDPSTPPAEGRLIADGIEAARFVGIPGAAHLGNFEQPELVNGLIIEHLKETSG